MKTRTALLLPCTLCAVALWAADPPTPREPVPPAPPRSGARPADARPDSLELRERQERLRAELEAARRDGKAAEVAELEQALERTERELGRRGRSVEPRTAEFGGGPGRPPREAADLERRQQHLREAVEHLRAAGFPELAQRVAEAGRDQLRPRSRPGMGAPPEAMEQLHAQLAELREAVQRLNAQVERLARDPR
jgi:hypothetical protein